MSNKELLAERAHKTLFNGWQGSRFFILILPSVLIFFPVK